jgi:hypothetical protein
MDTTNHGFPPRAIPGSPDQSRPEYIIRQFAPSYAANWVAKQLEPLMEPELPS